jgi:natural product precursor
MKKLSLGKLKLASEEVLERSQLSKIYGGSEGSTCWIQCDSWTNWRPMSADNCGQGLILCSGGYQCSCS